MLSPTKSKIVPGYSSDQNRQNHLLYRAYISGGEEKNEIKENNIVCQLELNNKVKKKYVTWSVAWGQNIVEKGISSMLGLTTWDA